MVSLDPLDIPRSCHERHGHLLTVSAEDLPQSQEREDQSCALGTRYHPDSSSQAENLLPCLVSQILTHSLRILKNCKFGLITLILLSLSWQVKARRTSTHLLRSSTSQFPA